MRAVVQRKKALSGWETKALRRSLLQAPLDLSELFTPGTFLNALRQQTARQLKRSMDELKLVSCWDPSGLKGAPLAVEISGVLLQVGPIANILPLGHQVVTALIYVSQGRKFRRRESLRRKFECCRARQARL
jgi:hypothetical protein